MKKILSALLLSALVTGSAVAQHSLELGSDIPLRDIKMKSTDNKNTTLEDNRGKNGLLVMFSCNTCPFVIRSQMRTKDVMRYALKNNIGMIIINSNEAQRDEADSYEEMKKYAQQQGYLVPYVIDENSRLANTFGASHTPEVFLFNKEGKLIYKGAMEDNPSRPAESKVMYLQNAMDNMIAGKQPDPAQTRSIGCAIKRKS